MVEIEQIVDKEDKPTVSAASAPAEEPQQQTPQQQQNGGDDDEIPVSEERILDAVAIEEAAASMTRVSARAHLEALAKKLRKEGAALKRVEESRAKAEAAAAASGEEAGDASTGDGDEGAAAAASATTQEEEKVATPAPAVASAAPKDPPKRTPAAPTPVLPTAKYVPIDRFSFDAGQYNSPTVTLYIPLPSVGSIPRENVTCNFTPTSFDLIVRDLNSKSYRLYKDNLDKDINPDKSKVVVKADKIILKLGKIKSEYGSYDYWSDLTSKKKKKVGSDGKSSKEDPQASIMELMKDMYDSGDDKMKKMIGETMMKQRRGELDKDKPPGMGMGLDDDLGDF